jgi:hypothetical protein
MRFLMNSLVALFSTAVTSCVPIKLSLDTLGLSCCHLLCEAWLPIIRSYWRGHHDSFQPLGIMLLLNYSQGEIPIPNLSLPTSAPLVQGTFPIPGATSGVGFRPTVE